MGIMRDLGIVPVGEILRPRCRRSRSRFRYRVRMRNPLSMSNALFIDGRANLDWPARSQKRRPPMSRSLGNIDRDAPFTGQRNSQSFPGHLANGAPELVNACTPT